MEQAIKDYIDNHKANPKTFVWTKKAEDILGKVNFARAALNMFPSELRHYTRDREEGLRIGRHANAGTKHDGNDDDDRREPDDRRGPASDGRNGQRIRDHARPEKKPTNESAPPGR